MPFAPSTMSNDDMRRVARVPGLRYWWQLYVFGPEEVRSTLIDRARDAGCEALIETTDAQTTATANGKSAARAASGPQPRFGARRPGAPALVRLTHAAARHAALRDHRRVVPRRQRRFFASADWVRAQWMSA